MKKVSGVNIKRMPVSKKPEGGTNAIVEIKSRKIQQEFFVEIRNEIREHTTEGLIGNIGSQKDKWLIVARYIPGPIKEFLKKHGYNYLEMTGNCFISTDQFISINNREIKQVLKTPEGKLWKATGLKFLFVILQDPDMLNAPQRAIARAAGIALGNISDLLEEMKERGYVVTDADEGDKLQQREKLIDRWVEAFHTTLRPRLKKGVFRLARPDQHRSWHDLKVTGVYWTGEPGADLYTNYLTPEHYALYSSRSANELIMHLKMVAT